MDKTEREKKCEILENSLSKKVYLQNTYKICKYYIVTRRENIGALLRRLIKRFRGLFY